MSNDIKKFIIEATKGNAQPYTEAQADAYAEIFEHVIAAFAENHSLSYEEAYSRIAPSFANGMEQEKGSHEKTLVREGVSRKPDSATAKVVSIPENSVPEFSGMKELANWLKDMLAEGGNVIIASTGQEVRFSSGNVKASVKRSRSMEHRNAYAGLREMVKNAEYDHYEIPDERHPGRGGQDVYYSALAMGGKLYSVKLKLDVIPEEQRRRAEGAGEKIEDIRYKDHRLVEIEIAPALLSRYAQNGDSKQPADAISKINLGVLRGSVKPSGIRDQTLFQPAYHGGPHRFERFSLDAIGTGEGTQAHGWGLYFAADRKVSEEYRRNLGVTISLDGKTLYDGVRGRLESSTGNSIADDTLLAFNGNIDEAIAELRDDVDYGVPEAVEALEVLRAIKAGNRLQVEERGQLFEVDIPENDVLLDEQKPFGEQSEKVQRGLRVLAQKHGLKLENECPSIETAESGKTFWIKHPGGWEPAGAPRFRSRVKAEQWLKDNPDSFVFVRGGQQIYRDLANKLGSDRAASLALNERGVKGITYDGEHDSRCFVVFDDRAIKVLETYYQFAGERGVANLDAAEEATTRLDNLDVARRMEEAGKDAKAIKLATGWERGADDKWRYEMPDGTLKVAAELQARHSGGVARYSATLGEIFDAPDLYTAYPELRNMEVVFQPLKGGMRGAFDGERVILSDDFISHTEGGNAARIVEQDSAHPILLHEIQHAIQGWENFATGGDVNSSSVAQLGAERDYLAIVDSTERTIKDAQKELNELEESVTRGEDSRDDVQEIFEYYENIIRKQQSFRQEANEVIGFLHEFGFQNVSAKDRSRYYNLLSGEVEARNVQTRLAMTMEERRASLATDTEDVAREAQIFLREGLNSASYRELPRGPLGSYRQFEIRPDEISKGVITFFESADISTAGHEMGHWLRQVLEMGASMKGASPSARQDWKIVCDYFGASYAGSAWTRRQEEAFADTFLAYLRKGEAPTEKLRMAFSRIQAWLTKLYSRLVRSEAVKCSPQIREVFDRLLSPEKHLSLSKEQKYMAREQNFYKDVAEKLIDQLQKGTAPWQRPWEGGGSACPYNPTTGEQYHGGNVINLLMQGYQDPRWMTFRQAKEIGARVRKGEHGSRIIFWRFEGKQPVLDEDGTPQLDAAGKPLKDEVRLERPRPFISYVFNAEQIEGLPPLEQKTPEHSWTPVEKAEELLNNSGALIEHHFQPKAYYTPSKDTITLPVKEQFKDQEGYYSTALHELGHWTGHESRLNRDIRHPFGSQGYAKEELRAEIASMMISMEIGIPNVNIENHAAYVQSWIKILREDPKEIFRASSDAGKILEYVMGVEQEQMQERRQDKKQELAKEIPSGREVEYRDLSQTKRVYLDVPYREKDQAKKLGAVFDRQRKQWYVPSGRNTDSFAVWLPKTQQAGMSRSQPQAANGLRDSKRVYLAVPYEYKERTAAKKAGALWDPIAGSWYAGPNADMERLARWLPGKQPEQIPAVDPREEFAEALRSMNFVVEGEHPVMDGKSHRISTAEDKPGQKSGFYVGHMDGRPAGYMKDNRTGEEMRWKCSDPLPSWENREKFQAACRARKQEHEAELEEQYRKAAERVQSQLGYMQAATSPLPYHTSKGIAVHSGGMVGKEGTLCLPAYDMSGKVWTMQYINADGTKRFAKESRKEGCYHPVDGMNAVRSAPVIVICEGYATACSVTESLGIATVAAFDSGNLTSVAQALHEKFPGKPIVIAGDDDRAIKINTGRIHAEQAAKAVGGISVFPVFAPAETGKEFTDFNDLAVKSCLGKDAVKRQVAPVVRQAIQAKQAELAQLRQQQQSQSQGRSL